MVTNNLNVNFLLAFLCLFFTSIAMESMLTICFGTPLNFTKIFHYKNKYFEYNFDTIGSFDYTLFILNPKKKKKDVANFIVFIAKSFFYFKLCHILV